MKSVIKRVAHEKNILATDIRPNRLSALKFRECPTTACSVTDVVCGKIGVKVILKYPNKYAEKTEQLRLYVLRFLLVV